MATNAKTKLRHDLIALGDEKGFEPSKVKAFYGRIEDNLGVFSREFVDAVLECVEKLSHKSHHYATLVGLVHNQGKNVPLVKQLVDRLFLGLQVFIRWGGGRSSSRRKISSSVLLLGSLRFFLRINCACHDSLEELVSRTGRVDRDEAYLTPLRRSSYCLST